LAKTLTIVENQWYPVAEILGGHSSLHAVDGLRRTINGSSERLKKVLGMRLQPLVLEDRQGQLKLRASGIAGALQLGAWPIQVVPKFILEGAGEANWHGTLLAIVRRSSKKHFHYSPASKLGLQRATFIDHVALAFIDSLSRATKLDPVRVYRTIEERSPVLRGRLAVSRQINSLLRGDHKLQCDVDYLDAENDFNQLLQWAVRRFEALVTDPTIRLRLLREAEALPAVSGAGRLPSRLPLEAPPQYKHFAEPLQIASHLASGLTHTHRPGTHDGYGYVLNMEKIFESFIERTIQRIAAKRPTWTAVAQDTRLYAVASRQSLRSYYTRPDNVLYIDGSAQLLIDAKYKAFSDTEENTKRPNNGDLYQMFASLVAHGCTRGVLIYPRLSTENPALFALTPAAWTVTHANTQLKVTAVSIPMSFLISTVDFDELEATLTNTFDLALE
jgi:5-methylcytosine-specific restriction enzyme subunit McrC